MRKVFFQNVVHVRPGMPNQTPEGYDRPKSEADTTWQPWDKSFEGFWEREASIGPKYWPMMRRVI